MEKVTGHTNLYRRNATYYFRARVPVDILDTYGKDEEKFSLKTKDYQEAIRRVRQKAAAMEAKFAEHRRVLAWKQKPVMERITKEQLKHIHEVYYSHLLEEDEESRVEGFYKEGGILEEEPRYSFDEYKEGISAFEAVTRSGYAQGDIEAFFLEEASEVLSWDNIEIKLEPDSKAMRQVARELQSAALAACEAIHKRNEGQRVETPEQPHGSLGDAVEDSEFPLLSEVIALWVKEKSRTSWSEGTRKSHEIWAGYFLEVTGDMPIDAYKKEHALAFKNLLLELPSNWRHKKAFKGMNIRQAASQAASLGFEPMHLKTAQKNLAFVSSLWNWISGHYDLERDIFRGIRISFKRNPVEERNPFTTDELQRIFHCPIYTGCESVRRPLTAGDQVLKDTKYYWVPLIGLFTGARSNEILQLSVTDIGEKDGVPFFNFNKYDYKGAKTRQSRRYIPIHQKLLDLGLLLYVQKMKRAGHTRLFPDANKASDGRYSTTYGGHFSYLLKRVGVKTRRNCFHSFRHTFEDACRENDVPKEIMDALQGHVSQDMSGRYGSGYSLPKLNEWLQRVDYRGLELPDRAYT